MDYGGEEVLDQFAESLQAFKADDADRCAYHLEDLSDLHPSVLLMESQDELTKLLLARNYLRFGLLGDFPVVNYVLDDLKQLVLRVLNIHNLLQLIL